jgi:hypothetical protein
MLAGGSFGWRWRGVSVLLLEVKLTADLAPDLLGITSQAISSSSVSQSFLNPRQVA